MILFVGVIILLSCYVIAKVQSPVVFVYLNKFCDFSPAVSHQARRLLRLHSSSGNKFTLETKFLLFLKAKCYSLLVCAPAVLALRASDDRPRPLLPGRRGGGQEEEGPPRRRRLQSMARKKYIFHKKTTFFPMENTGASGRWSTWWNRPRTWRRPSG